MDGWVDGWMDRKYIIPIAHRYLLVEFIVDAWASSHASSSFHFDTGPQASRARRETAGARDVC
jgi:hypothetical protein